MAAKSAHQFEKLKLYIQIHDDDDDDDLIVWVFQNPDREYFVHMETLTQGTMHINFYLRCR